MLKHSDIIEKLDPFQKVALVASAFGDEPLAQAGLPTVGKVSLAELGEKNGVDYASAVRAWDPGLLEKMTEELVAEAGAKLVLTPDLKVAADPYGGGLSEDPLLCGTFGAEMVRGAHAVGAAVGLTELSVNEKDVAYLDRTADPAAVYYLIEKPFLKASEADPCDAVYLQPNRQGMGYRDTCRALLSDVLNGYFGTDVFAVGEETQASSDVISLIRGKITLGAARLPLERAVRRYIQLAKYRAEGSVSDRDLDDAVRDGSALDASTLDEVVDEIIDFAIKVSEHTVAMPKRLVRIPVAQPAETPAETMEAPAAETAAEGAESAEQTEPAPTEETSEETSEQPAEETSEEKPEAAAEETVGEAAEETPAQAEGPLYEEYYEDVPVGTDARRRLAAESVVLLKNDGVLPLRAGARIAVLGEAYADLSAFGARFTLSGRARGYDAETERSDDLIPEAVRAANGADVVLVFLHPDRTGRRLGLPANRLALLAALARAKKKVVALVCGGTPVDMKFDARLSASLLVPADGPFAAEGVARVLAGETDPGGRLVRTPFDDADEYFHAQKENKDLGRMRVGAFVGYTRYTTSGESVRYPFGYGLSYAKFAYSDLEIAGDEISFTVRNKGKFDGTEVAQIYLGAPSLTCVAARKRLAAFRKIFLKAGESVRVSVTLPAEAYATYDRASYTENVETGTYRIYIGSSAQDVKLQGKRRLEGTVREKVRESDADYFPNGDYFDVANVGKENRLNEGASRAPQPLLRWKRAAVYAAPVIVFAFFLLVTVLILAFALDYLMLTSAQAETAEWAIFILAVVVLALIPLLGSLNRKRLSRLHGLSILVCPILIFVCLIFGSLLLSSRGTQWEEIALRVISCLAIGAPLSAVVSWLAERELRRSKSGANRWAKYYFQEERDERVTPDDAFEEAFRAAEEARKAAEQQAAAQKEETAKYEAPQFYDNKLTYSVMLRDLKQFVEERGVIAEEATLRNWIGAFASSQLLLIPEGDGAKLCELVAEYFGKKVYIDNAEQYVRYEDIFSQWKQGGKANVKSNLSVAFEAAKRESAYLHTVLIRHMDVLLLEQVFTPVAEVIARKKAALERTGEGSLTMPANLRIVVELDRPHVPDLPPLIAEVASVLSPSCREGTPAEIKSVVQIVGFERFAAMRQTVRDKNPIQEHTWKSVDTLDERCHTGHIGNFIWVKMELHASVIKACGGSESEALDGALATELMPWMRSTWRDEVNEGSLDGALVEIFGAHNVGLSRAAIEKFNDEDEQ